MICPHCDQNLLRRERTDRRCGKCEKRFALEPKENALRLHDKRVHRLVERVGDNGRVRYTPDQLWYAACRGRLEVPGAWLAPCGIVLMVVFGAVMVPICAAFGLSGGNVAVVVAFAVGTYLAILLVLRVFARLSRRLDPIRIPVKLATFRTELGERWPAVYGAIPQGMVTGELPAEAWDGPEPPVAAVVCPDPAVLVCLAANDLPRRLAVRLCADPGQVPEGLPAVVLHDASPQGVLFAAEARRVLGSRATVAGIAPRAVLPAAGRKGGAAAGRPDADGDTGPAKGLRLREPPMEKEDAVRLRAAEPRLAEAELAWLKAGWWFPLAAVRPAVLLEVVETGVRRALERVDPFQRAARGVGFLTVPGTGDIGARRPEERP